MAQVTLRAGAKRNLKAIAIYIARDNVERAASFADELHTTCLSLDDLPKRGVAVPALGTNVRHLVHGNYMIFYRYLEVEDVVFFLRVSEQHQDLSRIVFED